MKRLTLMRHGKSSWEDAGLDDFDRPLNGRGKRDAPMMGARLAERDVRPDAIITSPAERASKTARMIAKEIGYPIKKIVEEPAIYEAGLPALLGIVRGLDDALSHVMLMGHNPGFTELGNYLTRSKVENIPTCGVLCVDLDVSSWKKVAGESGIVVFYDYPKNPERRELPKGRRQ